MEQPHINLSELEKANRRKFVKEYLIDYDAIAACKRMGYHTQHAMMYSDEFLDCPYVSKLITDDEFSLTEATEESISAQKRRLKCRCGKKLTSEVQRLNTLLAFKR